MHAFAYPASHRAGYNNKNYPWMGARARLKASFNCNAMTTAAAQMVCVAMKRYGMILADNGEACRQTMLWKQGCVLCAAMSCSPF